MLGDDTYDIGSVFDALLVGELLGYDKRGGTWYESKSSSTEVSELYASIADLSVGALISGEVDIEATLAEIYLGELLGYDKRDGTWYESKTSDVKISELYASIADLSVGALISGEVDIEATLAEIYLGELLGYDKRDGTWYESKTSDVKVTEFYALIADLSIGDLTSGEVDLEQTLADLYLGELLGYDKREGTWYESKTSDVKVTELYASVADLSIGALISGEADIEATLAELYLGDLLGYEKRGDTWYDGKGSSTKLSRLYAEIAALTVGEMTSGDFRFASIFDGLFLGDVLGYTHDGAWYATNPDGTKGAALGKIDAALAGIELGGLLGGDGFDLASAFASVSIGDALGYYYDGSDWYESSAPDAAKVGGIKARIAGYRLGALIDGSLVIDPAQLISGMTIGEVMGYTPVYKLDTLGEPTDEIDYWCDADKNRVTGFLASIAGEEIASLENGSLMSKLSLGDALGYYYDGSDWYESSAVGAAKVGGIMGVLANQKIDQLGAAIDGVYIGEILGYSKHGEDWYEVYIEEDSSENVKASGIMAAFAGLTVADMSRADTVSAAMNKVTLGDALGYYYDGSDWYESSDADAEKVGGIMGVLADKKIDQLGSAIDGVYIGEILGYSKHGEDWYEVYIEEDSSENVKASGIMAAFAGLTVADMSRADTVSAAMNKVTLGDALGYYYDGSDWYESSDADAEKVGGIMGSLASEKIGGLSSKLESARIGELLGYTNDGGTWYDGTKEVTPIINKICNATFETLNATLEHLTLGDIFTEEQLSSGFLALLGGDLASRKAIELSTVPDEATSALQNAKIGTLMSCGILNISSEAQTKLDAWSALAGGGDWRNFTIEQFINFVVGH